MFPSFSLIWRGAAALVGLAALVPSSGGDLRSHPNPAADYDEAVARASRVIAADDAVVAPGGAPILLAHGARRAWAFVLLHGLTDSPRQFAALAESLYAGGGNVYVPRLPHHGERGKDAGELARLTAQELVRAGDDAVDIATGLGDSVVVLGLSVGGTLGAWIGEHRPQVRRVVMVAPAFQLAHVPSLLERGLVNVASHLPNLTRRASPDSGRPDREPGVATRAVAQVLRLGMAVQQDAERLAPVTTHMVFLINPNDHTVKAGPVFDLARTWNQRGAPASVYEFPDSLALPHNVVDPIQRPTNGAAVYAALTTLTRGDAPPAWMEWRR